MQSDDQWVREFARSNDLAKTLQRFKEEYKQHIFTERFLAEETACQESASALLVPDHLKNLVREIERGPDGSAQWEFMAVILSELMLVAIRKQKQEKTAA